MTPEPDFSWVFQPATQHIEVLPATAILVGAVVVYCLALRFLRRA